MTKLSKNKFEVFPWNKNFETGIEEIDTQHKKIVELLNKLANSLTQDKLKEVEKTFEELANYADYHFKCEESIWRKYLKDDTLYISHEKSHSSFLPKVAKLKERNSKKDLYQGIEDIVLFLIKWLAFHIIDEDKRLALIIHSLNDGKSMEEAKFIADSKMGGSLRVLIETILSMYDNLSLRTIRLIREKKARLKAERQLRSINKKLQKLSITDQLTGLYNRRHFENTFTLELKRAIRNKTSISVITFDIDYFKKLNDLYGHAQGDIALKQVSKCIKKICKRANDFAFRMGGEEFLILTSENEDKSAIQLAQLLQKKISKLEIPNQNSNISKILTISVGIISLIPNRSDTIDSIMKIADERLYEAKNQGRNTIIFE